MSKDFLNFKQSFFSGENKKPMITIVLLSKNEQKTIAKVLKALIKQTFQDFEIILVDDNSTDETLRIVETFSKELPITILNLKPNQFNYSYAQNLGAFNGQGQYICILVGHAVPMFNSWLADGLSNFQDPKVAGVSGHYTEVRVGYFSRLLGRLLFQLEGRKRHTFDPWMTATNCLIRRDRWQEYPFDEKLTECEDYDWACEMLARGYNIIKNPKFSVFHSHYYIGKPGFKERLPQWQKICAEIDKRSRSRKSFTKLKIQ